MKVIKFALFLSCINPHILIKVCEGELIYGVSDGKGGSNLFSIPLNGTKPGDSSPLFNLENKKVDWIECTGNGKIIVSTNGNTRYSSKLFQFSLNGVETFSSTLSWFRSNKIRHDWLTGNLYLVHRNVIDIAVQQVNMAELTRKNIVDGLTDITDLALNPVSGLMYISSGSKILQVNMDGSGVKELVSNDISHPVALAIDLTSGGNETLYWIDEGKKTIEFLKLNGSSKRGVVIQEGLDMKDINLLSYFLNIYKDELIYIDNEWNFRSVNKYNGREVWKWKIHHLKKQLEFGIKFAICDKRNKPIRKRNPCEGIKCTYLCVVSAGSQNGFECMCPEGKYLDEDGLTCKGSSLAVASQNVIKIIGLDKIDTGNFETITIPDIKLIKAFCYNPKTHAFIMYDSVLKEIFEFSLDSKEIKLLVRSQIGNVVDLGIDVISQNLYWIDSERQTLEVMSLDSKARKVLRLGIKDDLAGIFIPTHLTLDLLVTNEEWIMSHRLDRNISEVFAKVGSRPLGLTHDWQSNHFMWIEERTGGLMSIWASRRDKIKANLFLGPVKNGVIHEGRVYWIPKNVNELRYTKIGSNNISKVELKCAGNAKLLILNSDLDHPSLDDLEKHDCSWRNKRKNCPHICLPVGEIERDYLRGECVCADGFELGKDGLTCVRQKDLN